MDRWIDTEIGRWIDRYIRKAPLCRVFAYFVGLQSNLRNLFLDYNDQIHIETIVSASSYTQESGNELVHLVNITTIRVLPTDSYEP